VSQSLCALLQFELAKILLHDGRHGHAQGGGKILDRHRLLFGRILEESDETIGQSLTVCSLMKLNRQFLAIRHLPEVGQVRAHDRNSIGAGQMGHATAARGRGIGHHRHR
jgi:hypothetical protein